MLSSTAIASARHCPRRVLCRYLNTAPSSASTNTRRKVVFSGIQPTGVPHLGNYLGALSNWVTLQKNAESTDTLLFSIVGWHALTLPQKPDELSQSRSDMLATLLAIGLDPKRSIIFHQDDNQCHTELAWIFNCITPVGKLRRMTTWKARLMDSRNANDQDEVDESMLNAGLLTYPVLQAADILAYHATHVPVGEDQKQHIELARDIALIFNKTFCKGKKSYFNLPDIIQTPSKRILSLRDPSSKMSKSSPDVASRILLTDTPDQIKRKIQRAVTDSTHGVTYDPVNRPGVSNLVTILSSLHGVDPEHIAVELRDKSHSVLKESVVEMVTESLKRPREELQRIREEKGYLADVAREGAQRAKAISSETLKAVRNLMGLY